MNYTTTSPSRFLRIILFLLACFGPVARAQAQSQPLLPLFPKYQIMGVVYAPPGASSYVKYSNSSFVGASDSLSSTTSSETINSTTVTKKSFLGIFGSSTSTTDSDQWTYSNQNTSALQVLSTSGNSISTMGPISSALGINHDNDVIYIWLNPVSSYLVNTTPDSTGKYTLNWVGLSSNGCDLTDPSDPVTAYQTTYGCDPNQYPYPDIVGIPVWCLKNPFSPYQGCAQWLQYTSRAWDKSEWDVDPVTNLPTGPGLTLKDYADILRADPFVQLNGIASNPCHPNYGAGIDPNQPESTATNSAPIPLTTQQNALWVNAPDIPNNCGPATSNTKRFIPVGEVAFPVPGPNGLPSTYQGTLQYSANAQQTNISTDTHTVSHSKATETSYGGSFSAGISAAQTIVSSLGSYVGFSEAFDLLFSFSSSTATTSGNTSTWQQQTTNSVQAGTTNEADYVITGPQLSDNYTGPATFNVYQDNVYGTFAFYSPLEPKLTLGTICINNCTTPDSFSWSTPVQVGNKGVLKQVTLTNNSIYPMTMTAPAVTFSDPGFSIDPSTDYCSNVVLQPALTHSGSSAASANTSCTLNIVFTPVASDAPQNQTPIYATMVAAGTENASISVGSATNPTTQDVLVVAEAFVSGIAAPDPNNVQGATLLNSPSVDPYQFPLMTVNPQTETYTFTSLYSVGVQLQNGPQGLPITLANTDDYTIQAGSNTCIAGRTLYNGQSCQFTVRYLAKYSDTTLSHSTTATILASTLTGSGAAVQMGLVHLLAYNPPGAVDPQGTETDFNESTCSSCGQFTDTQSIYIVNHTPAPLSQISVYGGGVDTDSSSCPATLAVGQGCTVYLKLTIYPNSSSYQYFNSLYIQGFSSNDGVNGSIYTNYTNNISVSVYSSDQYNYNVTLPPAGSGQVVTAGGVAQYSFQIAPNGKSYISPITFSIDGLPNGATAGFNPAVISASGGAQTVTVSVQTAKNTSLLELPGKSGRFPLFCLFMFFPLFALKRSRSVALRFGRSGTLAILLCALPLAAMMLNGCSTPGNSPTIINNSHTYALLVTIHNGTSKQTISLPLTIQ